jgi:RNA polymerase sigma factor (sigma-70 family)
MTTALLDAPASQQDRLQFAVTIARKEPERIREFIERAEDAGDAYQDLIVRLLSSNPPDYPVEKDEKARGAWLDKVTRNYVKDRIREDIRHHRILRDAPTASWFKPAPMNISAEEAAMRHLEEYELLRAIMNLPSNLGKVAFLRYLGYSHGEIAGLLGITVKASQQRLARIKSPKVRAVLAQSIVMT